VLLLQKNKDFYLSVNVRASPMLGPLANIKLTEYGKKVIA